MDEKTGKSIPVNVNDGKETEILLSGYVSLSVRKRTSCRTLERIRDLLMYGAVIRCIQGYYIIHPMGWDAFGLPAENYAIKMGVHPAKSTAENINHIKRTDQCRSQQLYDWDMEVNTTDPDFYKWTQWIFVKMFKAGLAYEKEMPINWCPSCKTGLANEEVVNGCCERCGSPVTKKNLKQWMLKITAYADRLLNDLDKLDWPEKVKKMQTDWIGKILRRGDRFQGRRTRGEALRYTRPVRIPFMVLPSWCWLRSMSWRPDLATPEQKEAVDEVYFSGFHEVQCGSSPG